MRLIHIVFLTLAIFGMKYWLDRDEGESKPLNVLFILADDLGYGDLGCFGQEHIKTPAIDSLAVEGMKLTQHYSGSPVCAPSRCVLLTGKHTGVAYIRDNDEMYERGDVWNDPALEGQRPLLDSEYTLGELFQEKGYLTSFIGKWGLPGLPAIPSPTIGCPTPSRACSGSWRPTTTFPIASSLTWKRIPWKKKISRMRNPWW